MERKKTLTMNWAGLSDDNEDEHFFEITNRLNTICHRDLASSSDDDEEFEDPRTSFSATMSTTQYRTFSRMFTRTASIQPTPNYDIWMAAPGSITERRRRLLGSMGLDENKVSLKVTSFALDRAVTKKLDKMNKKAPIPIPVPPRSTTRAPRLLEEVAVGSSPSLPSISEEQETKHAPVLFCLVRSRSEGDIEMISMAKARKEEFIGKVSKQRLTRTSSEIVMPRAKMVPAAMVLKDPAEVKARVANHNRKSSTAAGAGVGAFFLIKNLDTGKEFIVKEYSEDGMWNKLSDLQTGKQLTMDEFEKTVGHSKIVKEMMKRAKVGKKEGIGKILSSSSISKSLKLSKKKGASFIKNVKGAASKSFGGEKELKEAGGILSQPVSAESKATQQGKNDWVKVRQIGKSEKELSALHLCQEFQAHEGGISIIKFSLDGRFLASGGEDKVIHVWEVQECGLTPSIPGQTEAPPDKKKRGKGSSIPDWVQVPEFVFNLSEKPYCSFNGHLDEVLDLSWSKSLLLSSSMDKTVRLWDLETKACLKFFAHNDYVTCIQFHPIDENYYISGCLDAKVRVWNIPARQVVDWTDIEEMVTAITYTPDGHGAIVGTIKGDCRTFKVQDHQLSDPGTINFTQKKKSQIKKITGFQFAPRNTSEILITSGDSRIRIVDGSKVLHKFRGFRNGNSQIAASFSPNGRYIISASEDSQVFVWKYEEPRNANAAKAKTITVTQSYEQFQCKDVTVAIPWPCTIKSDPSQAPVINNAKKNTKRGGDDNKKALPPLPKKNNNHGNNGTDGNVASAAPDHDSSAYSNAESGVGDSSNKVEATVEGDGTSQEEGEAVSRDNSGLGDSVASSSAPNGHGDSSATTAATASSNFLLSDVSNNNPATMNPSAWGLVIVTAGFEGEIRCYQNFGLPKKLGLQANLFGGPT
ncbi:WD repeat-containing protein YMR102C-like [Arachis duranensis]|uniref:WD repeat-containing protein YMR102C-like n=1 Tax=Arachis duranensis TaxID=130453 RepID=A0A6P4D7V3_ARADU|nr:WD repeat-containing protein YMR102C-like [Arachis duranensis]